MLFAPSDSEGIPVEGEGPLSLVAARKGGAKMEIASGGEGGGYSPLPKGGPPFPRGRDCHGEEDRRFPLCRPDRFKKNKEGRPFLQSALRESKKRSSSYSLAIDKRKGESLAPEAKE